MPTYEFSKEHAKYLNAMAEERLGRASRLGTGPSSIPRKAKKRKARTKWLQHQSNKQVRGDRHRATIQEKLKGR